VLDGELDSVVEEELVGVGLDDCDVDIDLEDDGLDEAD